MVMDPGSIWRLKDELFELTHELEGLKKEEARGGYDRNDDPAVQSSSEEYDDREDYMDLDQSATKETRDNVEIDSDDYDLSDEEDAPPLQKAKREVIKPSPSLSGSRSGSRALSRTGSRSTSRNPSRSQSLPPSRSRSHTPSRSRSQSRTPSRTAPASALRPPAPRYSAASTPIKKVGFAPQRQAEQKSFFEKLFGDKRPSNCRSIPVSKPRVLLESEILYNEETKLWICTIHTDQKALDQGNETLALESMQAHSFQTEEEANDAVIAMAPPVMRAFSKHPTCNDCGGAFAVFRRACHCRNCGVCICKGDCCVQWPSQSIPDTYNIKNESSVNVCRSCHSISSAFRDALVQGDVDKAAELYETGNINLRMPFAHAKGEIFYPVHCAVLGGSLEMVEWLLDEHHVPFTIQNNPKLCSSGNGTLLTSKGRSVMDMAVENKHVDIMRYLLCDKEIPLSKFKDLAGALLALEATLRTLDCVMGSDGSLVEGDFAGKQQKQGESSIVFCVSCNRNAANTIIVPCGHQACCLRCSKGRKQCPICDSEGAFMPSFGLINNV